MPIRDGFGYADPSLYGWFCENCWLSQDRDSSIVPTVVTSEHTRCLECLIFLTRPHQSRSPYLEEQEEVNWEIEHLGVCETCQRVVLGRIDECVDCGVTICAGHAFGCRCANNVRRCSGCSRRHGQPCPQAGGARRATSRQPSFDFLCDSEEEIITAKHVRPRLSKRESPRPRPGAFAADPEE